MTTSEKKRVVLDAGPVIRFLQGIEPGAEKVRALLSEVRAGHAEALMSDVNIAEVGRKIRSVLNDQGVDLLLALRNAGVTIRTGSDDVLREVIQIDLPLADAYAFATARVTRARLWTTDGGDFARPDIRKRITLTILRKQR